MRKIAGDCEGEILTCACGYKSGVVLLEVYAD